MKQKLFSFFFALALLLPANLFATAFNMTWNQIYGISNFGTDGTRYLDSYTFMNGNNVVRLYIWNRRSQGARYNCTTQSDKTTGDFIMPDKGNYSTSNSLGSSDIFTGYQALVNSTDRTSWVSTGGGASGNYYLKRGLNSSVISIAEGADGPYIRITGSNRFTTTGSNSYSHTVTIGSAATYRTVSVNRNDNSMGSVSYVMKSGYVYTNNITDWKNGSTWTLTATPNSGYHFVCWKKGNTQISTNETTDVIIDGNATYTAYFEQDAATKYTITTNVNTAGWGTVTPGGEKSENSNFTITATPASLAYGFVKWQKNGADFSGNTVNPITVPVTADATYTAVFEHLPQGVITVVSNYGTVTGAGSYERGTNVTLTVTPNSGYSFAQWSDNNTDNPRYITVTGDATYTAQYYDLNQPLLASFSWDDDDIGVESYGDGDNLCNSFYSPAGKPFKLLYAKSNSRNSKNYLQLSIQSSQSQMWGEVSWAKTGSYPVLDPNLTTGSCGYGTYWYWTLSQTDVCVAYDYDSHDLGLNPLGSYLCDKSGNADDTSDQSNYLSITEGITCVIEEGAGGEPYIRLVRDADGQCLVSVGEKAASYHLSWDANGGDLVGTPGVDYTPEDDYEEGDTIIVPHATREGYHLTEWDGDVVNSYYPDDCGTKQEKLGDDEEYVARWTANDYTVTFNGNGSTSGNMANQTGFTYGTSKALTTNAFSRVYTVTYNYHDATGGNGTASANATYTFNGWNTNADGTSGTNYTNGQSISTPTPDPAHNGTLDLYAKWTTGSVTLPTPTKTGYRFKGWYDAASEGNLIGAGGASYTPTAGITLHAQWTELVTFTIASYTNGTVTVSYTDNGAQAFTSGSRDIPVGTLVSFSAVANTNYHITNVDLSGSSFSASSAYTLQAGDGTKTLTANFLPDTYAITYKDQGNDDYSGSNLGSLPATHTYNTATNLVDGARDGYTFRGWYDNASCTGDSITSIGATAKTAAFTLYAKWELAATYSSVTFEAGEHGSVAGKIGDDAITSGQPQVDGSSVTLTATADEFYHFVKWQNESGEQVSTNAEYTFTLSSAVDLTAVFALPDTIVLRDNFENNSQWQTDYADLLTTLTELSDDGKVAKRDVRLNRTFAAERWSTFALPFGYSLQSNQTHPFCGHVYSLVSAQYEEKAGKGYLTLNCMPNTTRIYANTPYILITGSAPIENPVFNAVRLTEIEENTTTVVQDVNNTGSVRFVNTEYRQRIDKIDDNNVEETKNSAANKSVIYLSGNKLYYPGGAIYQNAFRAYFVMNYEDIYHVAPRVRLVMPDGESVEQAEEETVETKKYIENGILVIERNGIKYDAQGHVIK